MVVSWRFPGKEDPAVDEPIQLMSFTRFYVLVLQ